MKKLLAIVVLGLLISNNSLAADDALCAAYGVNCSKEGAERRAAEAELDELRQRNHELREQVERERQLREQCKTQPNLYGC